MPGPYAYGTQITPAGAAATFGGGLPASTIGAIWGDRAYQGLDTRTQGQGFLSGQSRRGRELSAPLSPLAMSLRNIEGTDQGEQAYKTALFSAGINPYQGTEQQERQSARNPYPFGGYALGSPQAAQQQAFFDRQNQLAGQRGRQIFDVTRNFVANYQPPAGVTNNYPALLQQRQQAGSANPGGDFGHYRSFLQQSLGR